MAKAAAVAEPETIDVAPEPSETARSGGKRKLIMLAVPVALVGIIAALWFTGVLPRLLGMDHAEPTADSSKPQIAGLCRPARDGRQPEQQSASPELREAEGSARD